MNTKKIQCFHYYCFTKSLVLVLLFAISSFFTLFSQEKNPYYAGIDWTQSKIDVSFPSSPLVDYGSITYGLLFGKNFEKFRVYGSYFPTANYSGTNENSDNNQVAKYNTVEVSRLIVGSDFLFTDYDASWFVGAGLQNIDAKVIGEFQNLPVSRDEVKVSGIIRFLRFGYTWKYLEFSSTNSSGEITGRGRHYVPTRSATPKTGDYKISKVNSLKITAKMNF
jgi:hypothetical protein